MEDVLLNSALSRSQRSENETVVGEESDTTMAEQQEQEGRTTVNETSEETS